LESENKICTPVDIRYKNRILGVDLFQVYFIDEDFVILQFEDYIAKRTLIQSLDTILSIYEI